MTIKVLVMIMAAACLAALPATATEPSTAFDGGTKADFEAFLASIAEVYEDESDRMIAGRGALAMIFELYPPSAEAEGLAKLALMEAALAAAPETMVGITIRDFHDRGLELAQADERREVEKEALEVLESRTRDCLNEQVQLSNGTFEIANWGVDVLALDWRARNGLDRAISKMVIDVVVRTEGRAVPWQTSRIHSEIPGGLEPGEERGFDWGLGVDGDWLEVATEPFSLDLTLLDVEDADGQSFVDNFGPELCAIKGFLGTAEGAEKDAK